MLKFSVIVPVYKAEPYLRQCIESVLCQSHSDFELILVDDGSPDACPQICDEYAGKDNCVKVVHQKNAGVAIARQVGVEKAIGDYLVFLDADDYLDSHCLEKLLPYTNVDMIRYNNYVQMPDGTFSATRFSEKKGYYSKKEIEQEIFPHLLQDKNARYYSPSVWVHAIKRTLFTANMVKDFPIRLGEDGASIIPCVYHAESMYFLDECLYYYCYNDASITKARKAFDWESPKYVYRHLSQKLDLTTFDLQQQIYRQTVHSLFNLVVSRFYQDKPKKLIIKDIQLNLKDEIFVTALKNARYSTFKAKMMHVALQYRLWPLLISYGKIKASGTRLFGDGNT